MRSPLLVLLALVALHLRAQDPDQNPYWTRYTVVEDSAVLLPLQGPYAVYYLRSGMWWSMPLHYYPIVALPEKGMRLLPLFAPDLPRFLATPAQGTELPDEKLVVVRGADTMVVELTAYYAGFRSDVDERCKHMDSARRPPVVLPFRAGRFRANGRRYADDTNDAMDPRTADLTQRFDALWAKAMKRERIIPQLNTDTCRQELTVPADLDVPVEAGGPNQTDVWVMRSAYCCTHFVSFPPWGTSAQYSITFVPYRPEERKDPVHINVRAGAVARSWVDVSDWPVGDHLVHLSGCSNGGTFTLKLR
ncbi:MAG: hypothetical protein JNM62_03730 [Flavobacteriales bacterium]|nr:hypothetical protein [Flavobacteriales bacterium]